jgi:hypothetical protein
MIIYLPAPVSRATQRRSTSSPAKLELDAANLRPPSCNDTRGSTPKGFGVYGPAVLPLFCLAPHGVFPASRITPRAVSSYLAISPLPAPRRGKLTASLYCQRTGGVFSVTLSVTAILQPRSPRFLRGMLPYGVRTFLQRILRFTSDHLPSACKISQLEPQKRSNPERRNT